MDSVKCLAGEEEATSTPELIQDQLLIVFCHRLPTQLLPRRHSAWTNCTSGSHPPPLHRTCMLLVVGSYNIITTIWTHRQSNHYPSLVLPLSTKKGIIF
jgi:hypothetical protein